MVLMSYVLYCTLLLAQALGDEYLTEENEIISNDTSDKQIYVARKVLLETDNRFPKSELQEVFLDKQCQKCIKCMERTITAHKVHNNDYERPNAEQDLDEEHNNRHREKRSLYNQKAVLRQPTTTAPTAKKFKRKTILKSVTVTKYNRDGDVFALKVKEAGQVDADGKNTDTAACQVYKVKKSYTCDSPEGDLILSLAKRKSNKRNKSTTTRKTSTTTSTETTTTEAVKSTLGYKKRHVDSQVVENYMPSIELYS